jgi:hypothetical protein
MHIMHMACFFMTFLNIVVVESSTTLLLSFNNVIIIINTFFPETLLSFLIFFHFEPDKVLQLDVCNSPNCSDSDERPPESFLYSLCKTQWKLLFIGSWILKICDYFIRNANCKRYLTILDVRTIQDKQLAWTRSFCRKTQNNSFK